MPLIASMAALSLRSKPHLTREPSLKLRCLKQAAKATFHRDHAQSMKTPPPPKIVIEISDDDSDYRPQPRRGPYLGHLEVEDDDDDDNDESTEASDSDDTTDASDSPHAFLAPGSIRQQKQPDRNAYDHDLLHGTRYDLESHPQAPEAPNRCRAPYRESSESSSSLTDGGGPSEQQNLITHQTLPPLHNPGLGGEGSQLQQSKSQNQLEICPYYFDEKFEVIMYRGWGYERFPVVLGTVEGHQEICKSWDEKASRGRSRLDEVSKDNPTTIKRERSQASIERERRCLEDVLQVFPRIQHNFVRKIHRDRCLGSNYSNTDLDVNQVITTSIIADIAELTSYPKQDERKRKFSIDPLDESGITIDWNKNVLKNRTYIKEAIILLAPEFDHVPTHYIWKIINEKMSIFDAYNHLADKEIRFFSSTPRERPYRRLKTPRVGLEKVYERKAPEKREGHQYVSIVNEFQAARQHQAREATRIKRQRAIEDRESENLALHMSQGSTVECQCCFDDKPINRAVPCEGENVHFFCNGCVERQAESQIGLMKYEMKCMDISECKADLSDEGVAKAIPIKLYDKLALNHQQAEISLAKIEGLETCPFCDFKAICEPIDVYSVFDCQNPDCARVSCRKCREQSHLPKTCEEFKNDKGLNARHAVEEARSEAMMRSCPKCKVKLIKEYGCNKMVCTNCRAIMCYICQKDISGIGQDKSYDHFHRSGSTCILHDQPTRDRHKEEADAAEKEAIDKAKAEHEDINEKDLQIETGKPAADKGKLNIDPGDAAALNMGAAAAALNMGAARLNIGAARLNIGAAQLMEAAGLNIGPQRPAIFPRPMLWHPLHYGVIPAAAQDEPIFMPQAPPPLNLQPVAQVYRAPVLPQYPHQFDFLNQDNQFNRYGQRDEHLAQRMNQVDHRIENLAHRHNEAAQRMNELAQLELLLGLPQTQFQDWPAGAGYPAPQGRQQG